MKPLLPIGPALLGLSALASHAGTAPPPSVSTPTRPQLSSSEQGSYTIATFLNGWTPEDVCTPRTGDYVVGIRGTYATVQAAVNAAIEAGGSTRKYIEIQPGTYTGLVVIPSGVPLTLYGDRGHRDNDHQDNDHQDSDHQDSDHQDSDHQDSDHQDSDHQDSDHQDSDRQDSDRQDSECRDNDREDSDRRDGDDRVVLQLNAHDVMTGPEFQAAVGHTEDFGSSAPAKVSSYYNDCTTRSILGTNCTATVISYANNLQIKNLTILNSYAGDDPNANGQNQAVAYLNNGGDQVILESVRLIGHQDTLWLNGIGKRTYLRHCFVAGDDDFIFGDMIGVFDACEIQYITTRTKTGAITAPSHPSADQGFLFSGGAFTSTGGTTNSVYFGRQWPQNGASTGQTIIRDVNLGDHIRTAAPWKQWDSTHPIDYGAAGNWRLAEYRNTGPGAAP
jgi:pectin methylesterase-like acyl-CoA thioesterase